MKKIFCFLMLLTLLNGCAESMALLGTSATSGKVAQSSLNTAVSFGVKKSTGKTPIQHVLSYAEKHQTKKIVSKNKIQPCVEFLEPVSEDFCAVIKSKILELSKIKNLN